MASPIAIAAFYQFAPLTQEAVQAMQQRLLAFGQEHGMRGLVLLATEGINGTVCGTPEVIAEWKTILTEYFPAITFNDSEADTLVYPRWFVKIRNEIVTLHAPQQHVAIGTHLSPEEWEEVIAQEDVVVLDARNTYETEIGMFDNAVDPQLKNFKEFAEFAKSAALPKDKKILMYCTGGIRCEKALVELKKNGYEHVYQLQGGILSYLKKFPNKKFAGECFVFDHRVSVNQELKPSSRYELCPLCGDPGDEDISCARCKKHKKLCASCAKATPACSKDCRNHMQRSGSLSSVQ